MLLGCRFHVLCCSCQMAQFNGGLKETFPFYCRDEDITIYAFWKVQIILPCPLFKNRVQIYRVSRNIFVRAFWLLLGTRAGVTVSSLCNTWYFSFLAYKTYCSRENPIRWCGLSLEDYFSYTVPLFFLWIQQLSCFFIEAVQFFGYYGHRRQLALGEIFRYYKLFSFSTVSVIGFMAYGKNLTSLSTVMLKDVPGHKQTRIDADIICVDKNFQNASRSLPNFELKGT